MTDIEEAVELLRIAKCPNCDGSGGIATSDIGFGCCGEPLGNGECCGNAIPEMIAGFEQCQWCAEKDELVSKYET